MKKILQILSLAALLCVPWALNAQNALTVADGSATNDFIPLSGYNADEGQHNQIIYPASLLSDMTGMNITQMVFYIASAPASNTTSVENGAFGTWTISLGVSNSTTLTGLDNTTPLTQVYQGTMTWDHTAMTVTITFDAAYYYSGGNLLVDINHNAASGGSTYNFYGTGDESSSTYR